MLFSTYYLFQRYIYTFSNFHDKRDLIISSFPLLLVHKNYNREGAKYKEDMPDFHQTTGFKLELRFLLITVEFWAS